MMDQARGSVSALLVLSLPLWAFQCLSLHICQRSRFILLFTGKFQGMISFQEVLQDPRRNENAKSSLNFRPCYKVLLSPRGSRVHFSSPGIWASSVMWFDPQNMAQVLVCQFWAGAPRGLAAFHFSWITGTNLGQQAGGWKATWRKGQLSWPSNTTWPQIADLWVCEHFILVILSQSLEWFTKQWIAR